MFLTILIALAVGYFVYRAYQYKNGIKWVYVALAVAAAIIVVPIVSEQISSFFPERETAEEQETGSPDSLS